MAEGQLSRSTWLPAGELVPITVSLLATLLSTFAISGITYVLLDLRLQLGLSSLQLNLLRCTAIASGLLIVFCASSLCRLFGAKRCLAVSLAMWIAGSLLMAGQTGLAMLSLGLILMGCADGCVRVAAFAMLCGGAGNGRQISLLIAANTLANGLAFVASPVVNSWLLSRGAHGAVSVGLLWALLFALVLLALLLGVRGDASPSPAAAVTLRRRDWAVLLAAGACAALISTLPIIRALQPAWFPGCIVAVLALVGGTAVSLRRSPAMVSGFAFLRNPRLTLQLLALAALFSIDYRYCTERFLMLRYQLDLSGMSAWMTPASLAGIAASFGVALVIARIGLMRTIATGLMGCLILPLIFITAQTQVPTVVIASAAASFAFFFTFVRVGLSSLITAKTDRHLLANLEAVRHVLATSAWSLGSALAVDVLLGVFRDALEQRLRVLPLSPGAMATIARRLARGDGAQVLLSDYGVSREQLLAVIGRRSAGTIHAIMMVLHGMGWLLLGMLLVVTTLWLLSRRSVLQLPRFGERSLQLR